MLQDSSDSLEDGEISREGDSSCDDTDALLGGGVGKTSLSELEDSNMSRREGSSNGNGGGAGKEPLRAPWDSEASSLDGDDEGVGEQPRSEWEDTEMSGDKGSSKNNGRPGGSNGNGLVGGEDGGNEARRIFRGYSGYL